MMEHEFTHRIKNILTSQFGSVSEDIFKASYLLQYLNIKTRSATRGTKARSSYANIYSIYVLVEDYLKQGFDTRDDYSVYDGAKFTDLLKRQRTLPFGNKLQNHALNSRTNEEFRKYFAQQIDAVPILRDLTTSRYWINEHLLKIQVGSKIYQIASAIVQIVEEYIETKRHAFEQFIETCEQLKDISQEEDATVGEFIINLLAPQIDARIFEIVSFAILKFYYHNQTIFFGYTAASILEENLKLYKTGRTNANDGGIDYVMRPLGRFFQVTETLDIRKYFLDIDKIEHYPISFVIKSNESTDSLRNKLLEAAQKQYPVKAIVDKYMACIEEIINIPILRERFQEAKGSGFLRNILDEIIVQSKVEFNYE